MTKQYRHAVIIIFIYFVATVIFFYLGFNMEIKSNILSYSYWFGPFALITTLGWERSIINVPIFILTTPILLFSIFDLSNVENRKKEALYKNGNIYSILVVWVISGTVGAIYKGLEYL